MTENYFPIITDSAIINANDDLLRKVGCSKAQRIALHNREYRALPFWVRSRLAKLVRKPQIAPAKLRPMWGERGAYLNRAKYPPQKKVAAK